MPALLIFKNMDSGKIKEIQKQLDAKKQTEYIRDRAESYFFRYTPAQVFTHMFSSLFKSLSFLPKRRPVHKTTNIGILIEGGMGDLLIDLNWLCYFHKKYLENNDFSITLGFNNVKMLEHFAPPFCSAFMDKKSFTKQAFDLEIKIIKCPQTEYADLRFLQERAPQLLEPVNKYLEIEQKYKTFLDMSALMDAVTNNIPEARCKRYRQPDIAGLFDIQERFILPVSIKNEKETLKKLGLSQPYITVAREVGFTTVLEGTKLWPMEHYRKLLSLIKKTYPELRIIETGCGRGERTGKADIDLTGKTELEELKAVMKNSVLHIDSEGGLVHLRHALNGGPSCVFFGPTSPELYAYSENINLSTEECPIRCDFCHKEWTKTCILGKDRTCMKSIKPEYAFERIKAVLDQI